MLLMGLKDCESGGDRKYKNQKKIKCKKCGNDMRSGDLYMYCKICWNLVFDEGVCTYTYELRNDDRAVCFSTEMKKDKMYSFTHVFVCPFTSLLDKILINIVL